MDPLKPPLTVLVKLGSLIVHMEEWQAPNGHWTDIRAVLNLRKDPEVQEWFEAMHKRALLPVKR